MTYKPKVLILGISGMDYKITAGLMAAGKLPAFRHLAERGSFVKLNAPMPAESSVSWMSLCTGLNPGEFNVFDAVKRDPLTYNLKLSFPSESEIELQEFQQKCFWELAAAAGIPASVHWPFNAIKKDFPHGRDLDADLEHTDNDAKIQHILKTDAEDENKLWEMFSKFKKLDRGLFSFLFDSAERLSEVCWKNSVFSQKEDKKDGEKIILPRILAEHYESKDRLLKKIIQESDPQMLILVLSNHGMTSFERTVHLNTWLVKNGFMQLTKELMPLAKEPNPEKEPQLLSIVDWGTTRAYALGFSSLYLNLEGREGLGTVKDKEPLIRELLTKLEQSLDSQFNQRMIHKIYRKEEIYSGPFQDNSPDLIIGFKPGYRMSWQSVVGGFGPAVIEENKLQGNSLVDASFIPGVLFSNQKLEKMTANSDQVTPTILNWLGIKTEGLPGKSLLSK